jgi:Domain of unknown function (DUF6456)
MPRPAHPPRSIADGPTLEALARLAAKGAYAAPMEATTGGDGPFGIFSHGEDGSRPVASVEARTIALACRLGWLAPGASAGSYRIAAPGIEALRRAKSGASPIAPRPRSGTKPTRKAAARIPGSRQSAAGGPLAWLRRRKDRDGQPLITEAQFTAGERLGVDFWHAHLSPRVTADWSTTAAGRRVRRSAPGTGIDLSDRVVAARTRVHKALAAVGAELAGILVDVCCHEMGLEPAGRARGWPERSAKTVLQLALTSLARHYGLLAPVPPLGVVRLRHWGDDTYRPDLEAWRS